VFVYYFGEEKEEDNPKGSFSKEGQGLSLNVLITTINYKQYRLLKDTVGWCCTKRNFVRKKKFTKYF